VGEQVRGREVRYIGGGGEETETLGAMSRGVEHVRRLHSPLTATVALPRSVCVSVRAPNPD